MEASMSSNTSSLVKDLRFASNGSKAEKKKLRSENRAATLRFAKTNAGTIYILFVFANNFQYNKNPNLIEPESILKSSKSKHVKQVSSSEDSEGERRTPGSQF